MLRSLGVESQNAEIMDRVAVDGESVNFSLVVESEIPPEWTRPNDVAVCEDIAKGLN